MILSHLPCAVSSLSRRLALSAHSFTSPGHNVIVTMSARTSLAPCRLSRRAVSPQDVLAKRHSLQVRGVDTKPIAAQMVNGQATRNLRYKRFIGEAMRIPEFWTKTHLAVRILTSSRAYPLPAPITLNANLLPETEGECAKLSEHRKPNPFGATGSDASRVLAPSITCPYRTPSSHKEYHPDSGSQGGHNERLKHDGTCRQTTYQNILSSGSHLRS